jgi:hypothetical protein
MRAVGRDVEPDVAHENRSAFEVLLMEKLAAIAGKLANHRRQARSAVIHVDRMEIRYRRQVVAWQEILERPRRAVKKAKLGLWLPAPKRPRADHPWRKPFLYGGPRQEGGLGTLLAEDSASGSAGLSSGRALSER